MKYIELCVVSEHSAKSLNFAHVYGRLCAPRLVSLVFPVGRLLEMRRFCQKDSFPSPYSDSFAAVCSLSSPSSTRACKKTLCTLHEHS